jgi:hypothetical protein
MEVCVKNRIVRCAASAAAGVIVTLAIGALTGMPIEQTAHGAGHNVVSPEQKFKSPARVSISATKTNLGHP